MSQLLEHFQMPSPLAVVILISPLFLLSLAVYRRKNPAAPPLAGGSWPIIGHLHRLGGPQPTHITLSQMADKYGPIFILKLGVQRALIVSDWQIAKECFTTNDQVLATRPKTAVTDILGYGQIAFGFAPYGPHWRHARRIATAELLSNHRMEQLKHVREAEVRSSIRELYQLCKGNTSSDSDKPVVDMIRWFQAVTEDMTLRMAVGKRLSGSVDRRDEKLKELIRGAVGLYGEFVFGDAFPLLRRFDIGGYEGRMRKGVREMEEFAEEWLEEHKRKRESCPDREPEDFMDVMLDVLSAADQQEAKTMIKTTILTLIITALDGTAVTMTWALSLLLNNKEALRKARLELEEHVGEDRLPNESDTKKLLYLQAVIKETMRLYPPAPLNVPHEAMEDCTVNGYHVQAGTWLFVNVYKIHHNPNLWSDPFKFDPDRFLTTHKEVDVRGRNFELLPFGSGRRMCPAIPLALQIMQLTLASLLHGFEFSFPSTELVDMSEGSGLTLTKTTPLQLLVAPRLHDSCYELN